MGAILQTFYYIAVSVFNRFSWTYALSTTQRALLCHKACSYIACHCVEETSHEAIIRCSINKCTICHKVYPGKAKRVVDVRRNIRFAKNERSSAGACASNPHTRYSLLMPFYFILTPTMCFVSNSIAFTIVCRLINHCLKFCHCQPDCAMARRPPLRLVWGAPCLHVEKEASFENCDVFVYICKNFIVLQK
jgi:hypothetical protein